jgi:hypothetical protein
LEGDGGAWIVTIEVKTRPEASEDIRNLGSNAVKLEVAKYLLRLEQRPDLGLPLGNQPETGDLSDCRKLYINERRHRIVYRLLPDETNPTVVDIIAVGERELCAVYIEAVKRLGR